MHPFNPPAKRRYWIGDIIEALAIVAFIWGLGASLIAIRDMRAAPSSIHIAGVVR